MQQTIIYYGSEVVVSREVAEFLEQERKRENAEERSDRRHKDFTNLETAELLNAQMDFSDPILNDVIREGTLERLRNIVNTLDDDSRQLIELHYFKECSLTATAEFFGITKQALSKRHTKLLKKDAGAYGNIGFRILFYKNFAILVYKPVLSVLISERTFLSIDLTAILSDAIRKKS